ncbi:MAG TPA: riboflavin synthase [Tepidisphaeraceae bacterium]|jgi:riboflavin synthase
MFTGIVERSVKISSVSEGTGFRRLNLLSPWTDVKHGESIAINGVCLSVAEIFESQLAFDVIPETLAKTNLGLLQTGQHVHVERALQVNDRISGHFLQGHVDAQARLAAITNEKDDFRLTITPPPELMKYIVPKGSVAIDGVSLTVASVLRDSFQIALIPTTVQLTHLGSVPVGWPFNLETDILSKTIVNYLEQMNLAPLAPR